MKKIVLNISDATYEKLRFEAIEERKSVQQVIEDRFLHKPFSKDVLESFDKWCEKELDKILGE